MDAGCGPGGTALQLCQDFKHVEAYDYSQGFVDMMLAKKTEKVCCVLSSPLSGKEDKSMILKAQQFLVGSKIPNQGICCQVTPPMQSGRVTKVALNDLSIVHFTK